MAIENASFVTKQDVTLTSAYTRITSYHGDKNTVSYNYATYKDQTARDADKAPLQTGKNSTTYDVGTMGEMLPACYTHLKTLTEFAGATDA